MLPLTREETTKLERVRDQAAAVVTAARKS